jgi:hypothetical protein
MPRNSNTRLQGRKPARVHANVPVKITGRLAISARDILVTWRDVFKILVGIAAIATALRQLWH